MQGHVTVTKTQNRENVVSNSTEEKNSHENDCSKSSVFSCRLNVSSDGCDVSVAGKLFHTRAPATVKARSPSTAMLTRDKKNVTYAWKSAATNRVVDRKTIYVTVAKQRWLIAGYNYA